MKDFPVFTTEYGVASLTLKEVPYREEAYVLLRDVQPGGLEDLLRECRGFCRMVGAERVYASHWEGMERFRLHTAVVQMRREAQPDPEKIACLFPVTESTVGKWREIYNGRMRGVDNAATLEARDEKRIFQSAGAYFIHDNGDLLGSGWLEEETLLAVASVKPGAGERILHTLMSLIEGRPMILEVASTNTRALRLYEKLGFLPVAEVSRWYEV